MMGSDLPEELWREIASFLEKKAITPLLGVNQLLRGFALDRIYEQASIDIGELGRRDYLDQISHLGNPSYATCIRKLNISTTRKAPRANARNCVEFDGLRGRKLSKAETAKQLLFSFVNLKEVVLFCVDKEDQEDFETQMPLLLSSLQAYSSTLTSIGFAISPLSFLSTFLQTLPTFPNLERLSLQMMEYKSGLRPLEFGSLLKDVVAPFISRHCQTLSIIEVVVSSFSKEYDLLMLLDNLDHVPHLKTLEIPFVLSRLPTAQSFRRFLERHSETVEDLMLCAPYNNDSSSTEGSFATILTPLPRLKHLAIYSMTSDPRLSNPPCTDLTVYVSKYSSHLSKFVVYTKVLGPEDWKALARMNWDCLTSLSLWIIVATPAVFDAIANNFPLLKYLSLAVSSFQETYEIEGSDAKFCSEMSSRSYPKHSLTHLDMQHKAGDHHRTKILNRMKLRSSHTTCVAAVVEAFPRVIFVNDRPRTTFLQDLATSCTHVGDGSRLRLR